MGAVASACLHPDLNDSLIFVWAGRGAMALAEAPWGISEEHSGQGPGLSLAAGISQRCGNPAHRPSEH